MTKDITVFAKTNFRNKDRVFGIKTIDRRQHMYLVGKSGTGKTTMLYNMVIQDIINGHGLCLMDPHGDVIESVVSKIPEERLKDVVYFNPVDTDHPIGFNVLEVIDPKYKHLVASDLMAVFTKIWANTWSARMEYILSNCVLALLDTPGTTLLGIPKILADKDYRQQIIANVKDPIVRGFWINEYETWRDQFRNEAIVPIQNKVGQFLSTSLIRNIVGQSKSTINISDIMNNQKIFLINLSKGQIGEDNSMLLGAMIVTKIQLAAMERVRIAPEERKDFYLYVDEFQNFVTDSFASILSEARKYGLGLIVAHQYIGQLSTSGLEGSSAVRDAIFGNAGTMIIFRVGAADAEFLEKEVAPDFAIEDMVNLPNRHIYLKLMVNGVSSRPFSAVTLPPIVLKDHEDNFEKVIESSRKLYTKPKDEVEEEISRLSGMATERRPQTERRTDGEGKYAAGAAPFKKKYQPREDYHHKPMSGIHLGEIGIEFEVPLKKKIFEKFEEIKPEETEKESIKSLSLGELNTMEKPAAKKSPTQTEMEKESTQQSAIDELKEAIKKAMEEAK